MPEDRDEGQINFVRAALKWQYNWIAMAGAAAFAVVCASGLPLILAAGLELIYLSLVPNSGRFQRLVRSWKWEEEKRQHEMKLSAMFHELPPEMRTRYAHVAEVCEAIRANYARLSSTTQIFVKQMEDKLSGLQQGYVRLLFAAHQQREYLQVTNPGEIERELEQLKKDLSKDAPKVQDINRKRIEILTKRLEKFEKIRENRQVIDAQCAATEDVLQLIRDQSVTMRDPQQISDQLETLVQDVEQTEQAVKEVEAIFELATPDDLGRPLPAAGDQAPSAQPRTRVRN
jgi:myosin heavy subunit